MARPKFRIKFDMRGPHKWLFAALFLIGGVILGIQIGNRTATSKAPVASPDRTVHRTSIPVKNTASAAPASSGFRAVPTAPAVPAHPPAVPAGSSARPARINEPGRIFSSAPKVAIVLDDWGYNTKALRSALAIREPLTIAILPHLPYSTRVAEEAHAAGHQIMLHMPMEPLKPTSLEKGTIMSDMRADEVKALLDSAIVSVPHLRGVNNHMGSKVTQDARILNIVMKDVKSRHLFFLNSMVTGSPVGREVAGEVRVPYAERDVFLDNVRTEDAVLKQLETLKQTAIRQGTAVGIGHDEPVTLNAIAGVLPQWRAEGIEVLALSDLIRYRAEEN